MKLPKVYLRNLISERLKFLFPQQATGYFGIFSTTLRVEPAQFRFEKDFNFYLNSSRAASSGEFKFKEDLPMGPVMGTFFIYRPWWMPYYSFDT
jgi:hypothetical protein